MQVRAVGRREKKGWVAASLTTCSLREVQQGCWEPKSPRNMPACVQPVPSMAGSQIQGGLPQLVLTAVARSIFVAATSTHFNKIPATTLTEPWFSDFSTRGPPYKAERSKYSTPKCSGMGRIFLLSLFIFYNVQHKMPGLQFWIF